MARTQFPVDVVRVRQVTERVREYLLRSPDGTALPAYGPGAHVALHTVSAERGLIVRHYSLIGGNHVEDDPRHTYRIAVQREDHARGSAHIHATFAQGTRLAIGAPVNNFPLDRRCPRVLLIAGGIGITPILSMARSLSRRHRDFEMVYVGRNAAAMAYHDEVAALAGEHGRFHYSDTDGLLDVDALLRRQSSDTTVYVCGPASLNDAVHATAEHLGWDASRVRSERFGASLTGNETAFDVRLLRSGRTVHVSADASILDALNAEGIPVLWDCRRGECGLCPLPVVSSDGALDHHDHYLTDDERAGGRTMCICVSRTRGRELVLDV